MARRKKTATVVAQTSNHEPKVSEMDNTNVNSADIPATTLPIIDDAAIHGGGEVNATEVTTTETAEPIPEAVPEVKEEVAAPVVPEVKEEVAAPEVAVTKEQPPEPVAKVVEKVVASVASKSKLMQLIEERAKIRKSGIGPNSISKLNDTLAEIAILIHDSQDEVVFAEALQYFIKFGYTIGPISDTIEKKSYSIERKKSIVTAFHALTQLASDIAFKRKSNLNERVITETITATPIRRWLLAQIQ
jgi:hypothetical protein